MVRRAVRCQTESMLSDGETILRTERLVLRRLRPDDADVVADDKNDPEVARYQDWDLPYPVDEIAAKITAYVQRPWPCPGSGLNVAIVHDGALIGDFGVGWDGAGTEAEIGYTLKAEHHGKGFATEVVGAVTDRLFSEGVERVTTSLDPQNLASIRVLKKVGFHREGTSRVEIRGEWVDDELHVLLREDRATLLASGSDQLEEAAIGENTASGERR
jgi:aminoglycoside 6'-N-acetyltransferase